MGIIRAKKVIIRDNNAFYNRALGELTGFRPPFITDAPGKIARSLGAKDVPQMLSASSWRTSFLRMRKTTKLSEAEKEKLFPYHSPAQYLVDLEVYTEIHTALLHFVGDLRGKRILEIGPGYGPYLFFLKNIYGADIFGIEKNRAAVRYAVEEGQLNCLYGDAKRLPFDDAYFDVVISHNFLDYLYLVSLYKDPETFIQKVVREIYHKLARGGCYFSQNEQISHSNDISAFHDRFELTAPVTSSNPVIILQK